MKKMYKLYFFNDFESVTDEILASFCSILPVERQERIKRYRRQIDKKLSAVSYIILLYALAKDYGIKYPDISIGTYGKPYLTDYPDIHFNISHCVKGCICAVSDVPIGVDIQEIRPYSSEITERVCSAEEMKIINNASDKACEFTRIWAMKESYVKMTGEGIYHSLKCIDTSLSKRFRLYAKNDCFISVCT